MASLPFSCTIGREATFTVTGPTATVEIPTTVTYTIPRSCVPQISLRLISIAVQSQTDLDMVCDCPPGPQPAPRRELEALNPKENETPVHLY